MALFVDSEQTGQEVVEALAAVNLRSVLDNRTDQPGKMRVVVGACVGQHAEALATFRKVMVSEDPQISKAASAARKAIDGND